MKQVEFSNMTGRQLVDFYNRHSAKPVKRFSDHETAVRRCTELLNTLRTDDSVKVMKQKATSNSLRPAMVASLKLDRTITCLETKQVWKNAYKMWRENPDWMTSGQQDRLTAQLYAAAKAGEARTVVINGRSFALVSKAG